LKAITSACQFVPGRFSLSPNQDALSQSILSLQSLHSLPDNPALFYSRLYLATHSATRYRMRTERERERNSNYGARKWDRLSFLLLASLCRASVTALSYACAHDEIRQRAKRCPFSRKWDGSKASTASLACFSIRGLCVSWVRRSCVCATPCATPCD